MVHKSHEVHIKAQQDKKVHNGNNDSYVPHHPEPGHGDNPHCPQKVKLWDHSQSDCAYDKSAHGPDRECLGKADDWRKMPHAHINGGVHSFHGAKHVGGQLRNSGHPGAHRVGQRKR